MPKPDDPTTPRRIGVREFRANLSAILRQMSSGRTVLVTALNHCVDAIDAMLSQNYDGQ